MKDQLTIGEIARRSGVPIKTIRFYEAEGIIPPAARTAAGYRLYTPTDVRRLHLVRRLRLLGLPLADVTYIVTQAFASACDAYAHQVLELVDRQRGALDRQIAELQALRAELDAVAAHVRTVVTSAPTGLTVATCTRCPLIDERTGEESFCSCAAPVQGLTPDDLPLTTVHEERNGAATERNQSAVSRSDIASDEVLAVLACDISARPAGAPTPLDLLPFVRDVQRESGLLSIRFDSAAAATVAAFDEAERRCCDGIGWEVEQGELTTLRITATPTQLDVLEQAWPWTASV